MSRGVLLIGGLGPPPDYLRFFINDDDIICAADSGLDAALAAGINPDVVIGDMDSISNESLLDEFPPECVERFPEDKDDTDAELGIGWLRRRNCHPVVMIGGGEGRLDHTLALIKGFHGAEPPDRWITAREDILHLRHSLSLQGAIGETVSVFPVGSGPWAISSEGLQWPLDTLNWRRTMSLSNKFIEENAELTLISGEYLLIRARKLSGF